MLRRSPMKRTGWKRKLPHTSTRSEEVEKKQPLALVECARAAIKTIVKSTAVMAQISVLPHTPLHKSEPHRYPALLAMAKGKPCLLRVPGQCVGGTETTVACHSNQSAHGKAGARKADDEYSVWGCFGCHRWLDQGNAPAEEKKSVFQRAMARQILEWRRMVYGPALGAATDNWELTVSDKDRKAAAWALEKLNSSQALMQIA